MRFPSLSNLFRHRRTKSDGALDVLPPVSIATSATRPASDSCINTMSNQKHPPSDIFSAYIPFAPLSLPTLAASLGSRDSNTSTVGHSISALEPTGEVVPFLMERIRHLEAELRAERAAHAELTVLKAAMKTERDGRHAARAQVAQLKKELADSQADVIHARSELYASLNHQMPSTDIHLSVLASENAALVAEKMRYRKFIELMVSAGGHKPVLTKALRSVVDGQEPEAAFVMAIKEAMARPGNIWRTLLDPVRGLRTSDDYLAQVACTVRARREAREWKKKATFWKRTALEDAKHLSTVTPSTSNISSILEELTPERKQAMDSLLLTLRHGGRYVHSKAAKKPVIRAICEPVLPHTSSVITISELKGDEHFAEIVPLPSSDDTAILSSSAADIATLSSSLVITASQSCSTTRASLYGNLPPLASQTFRENYSIKSKRTLHPSLRLSLSLSGSFGLLADLDVNGKYTRRQSISPSTSKSSQSEEGPDRNSRRKVEIVGAEQSNSGSTSASSSGDLGMSAIFHLKSDGKRKHPSAPRTTDPTDIDISTSSEGEETLVSSSLVQSCDCDDEGGVEKNSNGMKKLPDGPRTTPEPKDGLSSPKSSPSRLPVLKKVHQISISRPVLMDSTNAATYTFARESLGRKSGFSLSGVWAKPDTGRNGDGMALKKTVSDALEKVARERESFASSMQSSKIPMGQRIHRLDLFGTARRAMQAKRKVTS